MAKLNPEQIANAQSWLHDVFVAGGIYPAPKRAISAANYRCMYGERHYSVYRSQVINASKELCSILKNRKVTTQTFTKLSSLLTELSQHDFAPRLDTTDVWTSGRKKESMLAKYIAWFCSEYEFLWDNSAASTYEMTEIIKGDIGGALHSFKCFTSQQTPVKVKTTSTPTGSSNTPSQAGNNAGGTKQPQNNFKSRGALSHVAVDLLSTPGQKEYLSTPIYCVNGVDNSGKVVEDTAYIRPVESDPNSQAKYTVNNTNKVLFGKAKGYGYCQVYFTDRQAADDFTLKLLASNPKVSPNIVVIQTCQLKSALANGYFKIGTEYGPVYISASKLNESIQEAIKEAAEPQQQTKISNKEKWERVEEAFYHDL